MGKVIKVGIGGFGRSGCGIHANWLKNDPEKYQIVAVADELPERRQDAVDMFGCEVYSDYKEMLEKADFDLFVNATPSRFHVEAAIAGLESGHDLLNEKPAAKTLADFDRIVAAAKKSGKVFYPFQNSRFYPFFQKMLEIVESGVLGELVYIRSNWSGFARRWDWQTLQEEWGGNLLNTGPHPVDQAVVLFGEDYPEVFCKMFADHPSGGDAENFCEVVLHGKGKPTIEVVLNSFQAYPQGDMYNISGTCGGLTGGPSGLKWKYFKPEDNPAPKMWHPWSENRGYCSEQLSWHEETWEYNDKNSNETGFSGMVRALYNNLYEVLVNGVEPAIKIEQVRRQIHVMEQAHAQNPLPKRKK
jgi:predicted dehydrogenase